MPRTRSRSPQAIEVSARLRALRGAKDALAVLSRPGPYVALRGDLGMVGTPGVVFAPEEGLGLPAIAFGHDWLQPVHRYADLLRHLATWGVVAAAPASHTGPLPSSARFASDLRTTLEVCSGVRLGEGRISVDSRRTAFGGHGIGGGAAMLAAARHERVAAVLTLAVAQTHPSPIDAAREIRVPTLHVVAARDTVSPPAGHAQPIVDAATGPVRVRTLKKATHSGFLDGRHWSDLVLAGSPDGGTRRITRALVTAFLLHELTGIDDPGGLVSGPVGGTEFSER